MVLLPSDYAKTEVFRLLIEAEQGKIGFDRRLLETLLSRREETLAALKKFSNELREPVLDLREQVFDLYRHFGGREAAEHFARMLKANPHDVPDDLIEALAAVGEPAVEPLLAVRRELAEDDSADATFVLAAIGVRDPRIERLLRETLERDPYEGALCIGLYRDASLLPVVKEALAACSEDEPQVRRALAECVEDLENAGPDHECEAFDILSLYPDESEPLMELLPEIEVLEFLDCGDAGHRARAALSFAQDGYEDAVRDALLRRAKEDDEPKVRSACLEALRERAAEAEVESLLRSRIGPETEAIERAGAIIGLSASMSDAKVRKAAMELYESEETRAAAMEAMWRSEDPRFQSYFGPNLQHADTAIRQQAIQGVALYPIRECAIDLVPLFDDDDLRVDALFAYAAAVKAQITPKSARRLFDDIESKAGGFSDEDARAVAMALDGRLEEAGFERMFLEDDEGEDGHVHTEPVVAPVTSEKIGRNDPCPCGSGKKYKKCCGASAS